jgi:hypothetical protein
MPVDSLHIRSGGHIGNLEMDLNGGKVQARPIFECDAFISEPMIDRAIRKALELADRYQAAFLGIAFGNVPPAEVLAIASHGENVILHWPCGAGLHTKANAVDEKDTPMTKPNLFLWPKKVRIAFYDGRGRCLLRSNSRRLDLADTLMLDWDPFSRIVYLGMAIDTTEESAVWDAALIAKIERQIRYDLNFDAYHVTIKRLTVAPDLRCPLEFRWKLRIRAAL